MNIKAEDLRIGNWINEKVLGNVQVFAIHKDGVVEVETAICNVVCNIENVKPIELSPEVLEKCGWKRRGSYYSNGKLYLPVYPTTEGKEIIRYNADENVSIILESLHQFQNLIHSLTGEEITLTLNQ